MGRSACYSEIIHPGANKLLESKWGPWVGSGILNTVSNVPQNKISSISQGRSIWNILNTLVQNGFYFFFFFAIVYIIFYQEWSFTLSLGDFCDALHPEREYVKYMAMEICWMKHYFHNTHISCNGCIRILSVEWHVNSKGIIMQCVL